MKRVCKLACKRVSADCSARSPFINGEQHGVPPSLRRISQRVFPRILFLVEEGNSHPRVRPRLENIVVAFALASLGLGLLLIFIGRFAKNSYQLFSPCLPATSMGTVLMDGLFYLCCLTKERFSVFCLLFTYHFFGIFCAVFLNKTSFQK